MQHAVAVGRLDRVSTSDRVAQLQLPGEGSLRPLGDQHVLAVLVLRHDALP